MSNFVTPSFKDGAAVSARIVCTCFHDHAISTELRVNCSLRYLDRFGTSDQRGVQAYEPRLCAGYLLRAHVNVLGGQNVPVVNGELEREAYLGELHAV
jgi:hypothetical protein